MMALAGLESREPPVCIWIGQSCGISALANLLRWHEERMPVVWERVWATERAVLFSLNDLYVWCIVFMSVHYENFTDRKENDAGPERIDIRTLDSCWFCLQEDVFIREIWYSGCILAIT